MRKIIIEQKQDGLYDNPDYSNGYLDFFYCDFFEITRRLFFEIQEW